MIIEKATLRRCPKCGGILYQQFHRQKNGAQRYIKTYCGKCGWRLK